MPLYRLLIIHIDIEMKRYINLFALFFLALLGYSASAQQIGISVNTSSVWLNPGEETTIGINLNNPSATAFSAFQTTIALPEGVSVVSAAVGSGFSAFEASYGEPVDGKVKVMAVEMNSVEGSSATSGQLLALTLKASDDVEPSYAKVTFSDTNFSTPSGKDIQATGSASFEMLLNPAALKIGFTVSPESVTLNTGEETKVELTLSNPSAVAFGAFQTTLNLPAGISVEKAVIGSEFDGFTPQVGTESDGKVTVMAVELGSVEGSTLTSGVLMTLTLKVAEGTDPDTSSLTFTDSRFSTPSGKDINATGEVSLEMTVNAPATELSISPEADTIYEGDSATFTVTPTPANSNSEIVWTINTDTLAEITAQDSKSATVKGIAFGAVTVTATVKDNEEVTASATLIIKPIALTGLTVTAEDEKTELMDGETVQLTATYAPENATQPVTISWSSSDEEVATVDAETGLVTAHAKVGTATITATANNEAHEEVTGTIEITVVATPASTVTLNKTELTLLEGASEQLTATVAPETTTDKTVTWTSSAPEIATVSSDGTVTAVKYGSTTITATCGEVSATCQVTVNPIALTGLTVTAEDEKTELMDGETVQLTATYTPENATQPVTITWSSSDEEVATVDAESGLVTAHAKVGKATITATANNEAGEKVTGTIEITVVATPAASVTLNKTELTLLEGASEQLTATVAPETTTDKTVTWTSSATEVATVSDDGTVTAVKYGRATITATCGEASATCEVTVNPIALTGLTVTAEDEKTELLDGETVQLTATYAPENATQPVTISWSSSDEEVATVDPETGLVTAHAKVGTATITATANNEAGEEVTGTIEITVVATPASSVTLDKTELTIEVDETEQLTATVSPESTTDKEIVWSSSNPEVAEVDSKGLVKALKVGTATITATCGEASATCEITVKPDSGVESIGAISGNSFSVYTLPGLMVLKDVPASELDTLEKGIYIVVSDTGKRCKIIK